MSDAPTLPHEQVRRAVEFLLVGRAPKHAGHIAAIRTVMRVVAGLFAESRGLLPLSRDDHPELIELLTLIDFSNLPPESLGVLYESLLDDEVGTRKGAGTFYTPPQLADPTVRRTLQPLTHDADGRPKLPEQILALAICDPAMGSGAFLISALHWLTDALHESLVAHGGVAEDRTRLKREVVERCIHGVDIDPIAVELARWALWIDVADEHLPIDVLDRKLKCGNALIGCWSDRVQSYPPRREIFDAWCALWFWPADARDQAPTPQTLSKPNKAARKRIAMVREEHRFFHWELEFPEVFTGPQAGFAAIVGNPPWEIQKPSSREFFAKIDPRYRSLGKQEALRWQQQAFANSPELERQWIAYQARFKALANWVRGTFRHQGSADLNSYKLFLEVAHALLAEHGRLGMIVPSGLYTDKGTAALRELLLDGCRWEWLFGFENRDSIFAIDGRFKFAAIVVEKGHTTEHIHAAFMRRELADWAAPRPHTLAYPRARITQFSPKSKVILELGSERDLEVLQKLYERGVLLGDDGPDGWGLEYAREFDTTLDSRLFPARPKWEARGYHPDEHGHWHAGGWQPIGKFGRRLRGVLRSRDGSRGIAVEAIDDTAFPLFEGRMIGLLDSSEKGWVSGKGRTAVWRAIPFDAKVVEPQWLIGKRELLDARKYYRGPKLAYMRISSSTNSRTAISTFLHGQPAADSVFFLRSQTGSVADCLTVTGLFSSLVHDFGVRARLGGLNMSEFVIVETALPRRSSLDACGSVIRRITMRLALLDAGWYRTWWRHGARDQPLARQWAVTAHERLRLRVILDALVAKLHQLDGDELAWILRDCDWPLGEGRNFAPKGFWRVDKDQPPELRHTVLTQVAFQDLQRDGLEQFLDQNHGQGWMMPETLRLADYGLGHDDRAKQPQTVAAALGPRFHDWQLRQSVEESWRECQRHAELLDRVLPLSP
jgi:hypothetical protein